MLDMTIALLKLFLCWNITEKLSCNVTFNKLTCSYFQFLYNEKWHFVFSEFGFGQLFLKGLAQS